MIESTETQIFKTKISILTIPRENFWIFKSGILEIFYILIDVYENRSNSRYTDNDLSSLSSNSDDKSFDESFRSNSNKNLYDQLTNSIDVSNEIESDNNNNNNNNESESEFQSESESDNEYDFNYEIEDDGLFFHLAFTTEEVTLMCSTKLIKKYLNKALKLDKNSTLISDEFFIIQVFSDGLNIGKKILELTKPLSLNNISLFFISNYFSDLVLIPIKDKLKTLKILNNLNDNEINQDFNKDNELSNNLELKTFELFKENEIKAKLVTDVKLLLTGARTGDCAEVLKQTAESISRLNTEFIVNHNNNNNNNNNNNKSKNNNKAFPEFFAITRTPNEEIGLLLPYDNNELNKLKFSKNNIMGSLQDFYYPIFIDLKKLPLDLKGIVSGIASKLIKMNINEMSYLSLGKSGIVLIPDMFKDQVEGKIDF